MIEKDLLEKMLKEARLTPEEEAQLDAMLSNSAQSTVSNMVASTPEEELSLGWRSELNVKLAKESSKRQRRSKIFFSLRPAVGVAFASAFAFMLWSREPMPQPAPYKQPLELKMVATHEEATNLAEVPGTSVSSLHNPSKTPPREDWTEVDVNAL